MGIFPDIIGHMSENVTFNSPKQVDFLAASKFYSLEFPERISGCEIFHTNISKRSSFPHHVLMVNPFNILEHEKFDPEKLLNKIDLLQVGWNGPPLAGIMLDSDNQSIKPEVDGVFHQPPGSKIIMIDGANRLSRIKGVINAYSKYDVGLTDVRVPVSIFNYFDPRLVLDTFDDFDASQILTKETVVERALAGDLVDSKQTKHGMIINNKIYRIWRGQPHLRMPLHAIFSNRFILLNQDKGAKASNWGG